MCSKLRPALLLALLFAFAGISNGWSQTSTGPALGEPAPRIVASQWVCGTPVEDFEPGQVYVIDLWSTWCKPCIDSMPIIHALESQYSEGLAVIAMNVWELAPDRVPQFVESSKEILPAYVAMTNHFIRIGEYDEARRILQSGLARLPDADVLKRKLSALAGSPVAEGSP